MGEINAYQDTQYQKNEKPVLQLKGACVQVSIIGGEVLLEIEEVRGKIKQLDESSAKSLLMIIYARLDTALNGTGGDEFLKQTVKELYDIYSRIPEKKK